MDRILTPPFAVAFPCLIEPRSFENADGSLSKPKYSVVPIWTPGEFSAEDKGAWRAMGEALNAASQAAFGKPYGKLPQNIKRPLRDGAEREDYDDFGDGRIFATLGANAEYPPTLVDQLGKRNSDPAWIRSAFRRGAVARAIVNVWTYDVKVNKGIAFGLLGMQLVSESELVGGAEVSFDAIPGAEAAGAAAFERRTEEPVEGDEFDDGIPF